MATANALLFYQDNFATKRVNSISGVTFPNRSDKQDSHSGNSFEDILQDEKQKLQENTVSSTEQDFQTVDFEKINGKMMGYSNRAVVAYYLLTQPQTDLKG